RCRAPGYPLPAAACGHRQRAGVRPAPASRPGSTSRGSPRSHRREAPSWSPRAPAVRPPSAPRPSTPTWASAAPVPTRPAASSTTRRQPAAVRRGSGRSRASGLVRRGKCPSDERGVLAAVTSAGRAALGRAAPGHVRVVRHFLIDTLTAAQRSALRDGLAAARGRLGPRARAPRAGAPPRRRGPPPPPPPPPAQLALAILLEGIHELPGRLATPGVDDQFRELVSVDRWQPDKYRREAVVVRLGEKLRVVGGEQGLLLMPVGYPDGHHVGPGDTGFLWLDALRPDPGEAFLLALVVDGEGEPVLRLARPRK